MTGPDPRADPSGPVLRTAGLDVRRARRTVVHGVDLTVAPGEVVAVLGPNGAGKSTLLEALGGVIASSGTLERHGRVATVLQTPGLARRSVRANVLLALAWWGVPRSQRRERADRALALMRADHLARRPAGSLSGGERRRVHLARGVAVGADLLLLDEPFAGLDPETQAALCLDTASALREASAAVVVTLHDRADAWAMADRVVVVIEGRVVADDSPDGLLERPPSAAVARFLGFDGELREDDHLRLTRPPHVRVLTGPESGSRPATVTRVVRLQDGARVELRTGQGSVHALHPDATLAEGQQVHVVVTGGVRFPVGAASGRA